MTTTYVLGEIEVKKTGRTASRQVGKHTHVLAEVTPVDEFDGTWKKWVAPESLFEIQEELPHDDNDDHHDD